MAARADSHIAAGSSVLTILTVGPGSTVIHCQPNNTPATDMSPQSDSAAPTPDGNDGLLAWAILTLLAAVVIIGSGFVIGRSRRSGAWPRPHGLKRHHESAQGCDHGLMTELAPFRLDPVLVERPWGGRRLAEYGKSLPKGTSIGESWELCDLPQRVVPSVDHPSSTVLDGPYAGARLRTVVAEAAEALLGPVAPTAEGRFPLLFKLLDARENLSVQVHPHREYVAAHPEARLKTESWYIIDADPGAVLYLDVTPSTDLSDVKAVMGTRGIVPLLRELPAVPGAFHHVPAGLIHALGAGTFVAEVQTPSDTTFRIYDWAVEYGRAPRQLHPAESIGSIRLHPDDAFSLAPTTAVGVRELVRNDYYWMREHRVDAGVSALAASAGPSILSVVDGAIALGDLRLAKGTTAIVPASSSVSAFEAEDATVMEMGF